MEKHLLELWLRLYLLKTYHARTNDDDPTQWVQWQDVEQTICDFIQEHKLKQVGHTLTRRKAFVDDDSPILKGVIAQLQQRLQDRDEQQWAYMNPVDVDIAD